MTNTDKPTDIDWARLAAYIDGEGCITIGLTHRGEKKPPILFVEVQVANTDPRLLHWIRSTFGGLVMTSKKSNAEWACSFKWYRSSRSAAKILEGCLPYFVIKREQAEVALAFQKTTRRWGVKGRPHQVVDLQFRYREQLQQLKGTSSRANKLRQEAFSLPTLEVKHG